VRASLRARQQTSVANEADMDDIVERDTVTQRKITQITPGGNFCAIFFDEENGEPWIDSIVAWAHIESPSDAQTIGSRSVIGLVADGKEIVFVDEFPNFVGYLSPESSIDVWRDRVKAAWEAREE